MSQYGVPGQGGPGYPPGGGYLPDAGAQPATKNRGPLLVVVLVVFLLGLGIGLALVFTNKGKPVETGTGGSTSGGGAASTSTTSGGSDSSAVKVTSFTMPNVKGMTKDKAISQLTGKGLSSSNVAVEEKDDTTTPAGTVIDSTPKEGDSVAVDGRVTLTVSKKPDKMPDFVQYKTFTKAKAEAGKLGIDVKEDVQVDLDNAHADGEVLGQSPKAGEPFAKEVTLTVSKRPAADYLQDEKPVNGSPSKGSATIGGTSFNKSLFSSTYVPRYDSSAPEAWHFDYNLEGRYDQFVASIGIGNDTNNSTYKVEFRVYVDNVLQDTVTTALGKLDPAKEIKVDLTGKQVLRLEMVGVGKAAKGEETGRIYPVWGDARILRSQSATTTTSSP